MPRKKRREGCQGRKERRKEGRMPKEGQMPRTPRKEGRKEGTM